MQIGDLARRFDVAPSKIRFLEDQGLVRPVRRTQAGYREYDESSADALGCATRPAAPPHKPRPAQRGHRRIPAIVG